MTRETKIGLFVGMGVIILIGILISDHLSEAQRQQPAQLSETIVETAVDPAETVSAVPLQPPQDTRRLVEPRPVASRSQPPAQPAPAEPIQPAQPSVLTQDLAPRALVVTQESPDSARPGDAFASAFEYRPDAEGRLTQADADRLNRAAAGRLDLPQTRDAPPAGTAASTTPRRIVHEVKPSQTLSAIAREYYGDPNEWRIIAEANGIKDPARVAVGTKLQIPNVPAGGGSGAAAVPNYTEYTLQRGETFAHVAERFLGSQGRWREIYELNKDQIKDPNVVPVGTVLRIPRQ